jgi:hypothetical protein
MTTTSTDYLTDPDQIDAVNEWRENQPHTPSFSEAVRTLIEWGLELDT